jgi:hypothetical protein
MLSQIIEDGDLGEVIGEADDGAFIDKSSVIRLTNYFSKISIFNNLRKHRTENFIIVYDLGEVIGEADDGAFIEADQLNFKKVDILFIDLLLRHPPHQLLLQDLHLQ